MHLVYGYDREVAAFVAGLMPNFGPDDVFRGVHALGIVSQDGHLVGGFVLQPRAPWEGEISVGFTTPRALTKNIIRDALRYAMVDLGFVRLVSRTELGNKRARRLTLGMGFRETHKGKRAWDGARPAIFFELTIDDCPWIEV
jgi:RimJ/RimL family protein N-acetyltransferase